MIPKFIIATAVPFYTARLQTNLNRGIVRQVIGAEKRGRMEMEKDSDNSNNTCRKVMRKLSPKEKLHLRRERNKAAAQISREKVKLQQNSLEQRLSDLKYEKMKLLLENEALKKQNTELEEENIRLNHKAQNMYSVSANDECTTETTIKHAWFVNFPLLKEWVVSRIFIILLMSSWESLTLNTVILGCQMPHFRMLQSMNISVKSLIHLVCLPWKLMIPLARCRHSFLILNG